jgi:hypothetical protein
LDEYIITTLARPPTVHDGITACLHKPFDPADVLAAVRRACDRPCLAPPRPDHP